MYIASSVFFNIYKIHYGKKEEVKQIKHTLNEKESDSELWNIAFYR